MKEILQVNHLCKTFRLSTKQQKLEQTKQKTRLAVDNVTFTAYAGEIFGLLGPNGAGKTTTMRMLATLIRPDSGDALVNGASIITQENEVRSNLAFLTGELRLEEFFTPNYLFDFFAALHRIDPAVRDQRKKALFTRFGIDKFAEVKVANLSQGMKQKVSIAVSIVHDPDIIIFDEPTNGLDVLTAKVVTDYLLELKQRGKTILVSTHIFSLIEKVCDRVGILIGGKLVACDTLQAICAGESLEDRFFTLYAETAGDVE